MSDLSKPVRKQPPFRNIILMDIDHTLSNAFWRDHLMGIDWDVYHEEGFKDAPIGDIILMSNCLRAFGYEIVGLTARPEKWRTKTTQWCNSHDVRLDHLVMRAADNFDPAPKCKIASITAYLGDSFPEQIAFIIDDREDVCGAFSALGITTLMCNARRT